MFTFNHPVNIHFGEGEFSRLDAILEPYGYQKYVVVASNSQVKNGTAALIESMLGDAVKAVVTGIEPNPTIENVEAVIDELKAQDAEAVIAIGGGSTMDAAKAAAAGYVQNVEVIDLLNHQDFTYALPVIAIPTTSGSASEVTASSIISNKALGLKVPLIGPGLYPEAAVVDPELTITCPEKTTAVSGIDVLCHALDCLGSVKNNPMSDALAIRASKIAFQNLLTAFHEPGNKKAREEMALASMMAGVAFSQTGTSGSHAMSYYLTSHYDVPHGEACAFSMDQWFVINAEVNPKLNAHAKDIGFYSAAHLAERFNELKKEMGLGLKLSDFNIPEDDVEIIAEKSLEPANMKNNIAQLTKDELVQFLKEKI
ncbi:iron-containing alcohol dehydrogenase [Corticicoccus populi]|uniref:Iron-containing alcohol dehydrogenase n=1 Tax=Corticicoccus populi TaxID=1812821 RepID=A0ABW5WX94_9STAP